MSERKLKTPLESKLEELDEAGSFKEELYARNLIKRRYEKSEVK